MYCTTLYNTHARIFGHWGRYSASNVNKGVGAQYSDRGNRDIKSYEFEQFEFEEV